MEISVEQLFNVVPYPFILASVFFYFLSKKTSSIYSLLGLISFFVFMLMGVDAFKFVFIFVGIYSLGYHWQLCIKGKKELSVINITLGLIALFFPIVLFSLLSQLVLFASFGGGEHVLLSTASLINTCLFILATSTILFIYNEKQSIQAKLNSLNGFSSFVDIRSFIFVTLIASIVCYAGVPVINYDDLATHYYIQNRFALGHYPLFDVRMHVWAVSQWIFDIYYGLFEFIFKGNGRFTLNLLLSIGIISTFYSLLVKYAEFNRVLLFILLSVSTPLFALSLTTSQTELITLLLLSSIAHIGCRYKVNTIAISLPIFAFSVALKPSNAVLFIFPFLLFLYFEMKLGGVKLLFSKRNILSLILSCIIAFSAYIFAFIKTGNPFYPLYNAIFKADYFPHTDFFNALYSGKFDFSSFWGIIFNTSQFLESKDGVVGFQLLFYPIIFILAPFLYKKNRRAFLLVISILLGGVSLFYFQQYARYIMPPLVVIPVLILYIVANHKNSTIVGAVFKKVFSLAILIVAILNIVKVPDVIWYLNNWKNYYLFSLDGGENKRDSMDSILKVNDYLNSLPGKVKVVYHSKPFASNLNADFIYDNWYNTAASAAFGGSKEQLLKYLKSQSVTHAVLSRNSSLDGDSLRDIADDYGTLIYQDIGYDVFRLNLFSVNFTDFELFQFGKPTSPNPNSYVVDSSNFYILKFTDITNADFVSLKFELRCASDGVWKDYLEFNRDTDFTNYFQAIECSASDRMFYHEVKLKLPAGTNDVRLFLQPIQGEFTVNSITIEAI